MLEIAGIEAGYDESQVLFGMELRVGAGELVTLLGRNGMGKTTTIRAVMGLLRPSAGQIHFAGKAIAGAPPHRVARLGIGLVPEGRQVFRSLSVAENLQATARPGVWDFARVLDLFPRLAERLGHRGHQLSGGEQQMLAIGRALMTNPRLLILDEATEGLAPLVREEIWHCLGRLRAEGQSILLVDKNLQRLIDLADRHVVVEKGRTVWQGTSAELTVDRDRVGRYLGV